MAQISGRDNLFPTLLMCFEFCSGLDFEVQALVWSQVPLCSVQCRTGNPRVQDLGWGHHSEKAGARSFRKERVRSTWETDSHQPTCP